MLNTEFLKRVPYPLRITPAAGGSTAIASGKSPKLSWRWSGRSASEGGRDALKRHLDQRTITRRPPETGLGEVVRLSLRTRRGEGASGVKSRFFKGIATKRVCESLNCAGWRFVGAHHVRLQLTCGRDAPR
jgi:hypothetical protein